MTVDPRACFGDDDEVPTMALVAEFCAEHRALEAQAAQLLGIVSGAAPDAASIAAIRWRMVQALSDHCSREDLAVYDWLISSGDAAAISVAWRFREEYGRLATEFARYIAEWSVGRIASEWPLFRVESEAIVARLAERIAREETVLFPEARRVQARRAA
ncbi:hemerythrin domain-containing protein [Sphingomonas sp. CJ20]